MNSNSSGKLQRDLGDTDDNLVGVFYRSFFWFCGDDVAVRYLHKWVSRSSYKSNYFPCGTVIVSFCRIVFYKEDLCSGLEIQHFGSKHGFFDRIQELLVSRSRGDVGTLFSCQFFKFFIIDPIDIDIVGIEFDGIGMSDLGIHPRPEQSYTLLAGLSFPELIEDDTKVSLILSMLGVEIADSEIEFFPSFRSEGESLGVVCVL